MDTFTDWLGDKHEVTAGVMRDTGGRTVGYDDDLYSPEEARRLGRALIAAADLLERPLVAIAGGAE